MSDDGFAGFHHARFHRFRRLCAVPIKNGENGRNGYAWRGNTSASRSVRPRHGACSTGSSTDGPMSDARR